MAIRTALALLVAATAIHTAAPGGAQVATDEPASIVIFPRIIADGTRDTIIQLSNTSNAPVAARCWYVDGAPAGFGEALWTVSVFDIMLTQQQPTNWVASLGRALDPSEMPCRRSGPDYDCYGAGFDPGAVPAVPIGFTGEMRCVETDVTGAPVSGNHLIGEATLDNVVSGDVAKYSAIGIAGLDLNDGDGTLRLGEEYAACPGALVADHLVDGAEVAAVGPGSAIATEVTVVPCTANLETEVPETVIVLFSVNNEFEQRFSAATAVRCWSSLRLRDINPVFDITVLGTRTAQTRMRPSAATASSFLALVDEMQMATPTGPAASASANVYVEGVHADPDLITLP